jgi:hypothetical protein
LPDHFRWISGGNTVRWNGLTDNTHRANNRVIANRHAFQYHDPTAQPNVVANDDGEDSADTSTPAARVNLMKVTVVDRTLVTYKAIVANLNSAHRYQRDIVAEGVPVANNYLRVSAPGLQSNFTTSQTRGGPPSKCIIRTDTQFASPATSDEYIESRAKSKFHAMVAPALYQTQAIDPPR